MKFIVTLTSYGSRLEQTAPYAIYSLLNQTEAPDKLILWLAHNTPIPSILEKLTRLGLEIKFCEDTKSYKKLVPALIEYPNDILITADDDLLYPKNWFQQLKEAFVTDPTKIYAHRAYRILFDNKGDLLPYKNWMFCREPSVDEICIFPTTGGGILYPPKSLHRESTNENLFRRISPLSDEVWFWAMARLQGTKVSIIKNGYSIIREIPYADKSLWKSNLVRGRKDEQIKAVIKRYPSLINIIHTGEALHSISINPIGPEVSVIMPCFNCEKYVGYAIESILSQTFKNFELIIVNDGSTDNTDAQIQTYLPDQRIRYHSLKKNIGNYPARNVGMKMARGKYIAVMDADDIADINRLLLQYEYMHTHKNVGCIGSQGYWINEHNEITGNLNKLTASQNLKVAMLRNNSMLHPSLMFKSELIKTHNLFYNEQLTYAADYDFVARVSYVSKVVNIPERLMKYRVHPKQISVDKSAEQACFADIIRLTQLERFDVVLTAKEIEVYQKVMKHLDLIKNELEQCLEVFSKLLESNKRSKLFVHKYLFEFFNGIIEAECLKYRRRELQL